MSEVLTGDTIAAIHSAVGARRPIWPLNLRAEAHAIRRFALGVGDDNPLWWGEGRPRAVPPAFLYTGVNFGTWPESGMPPDAMRSQPTTTLWLRDRWTWHRPLRPDEGFRAASEIVETAEQRREGGVTGMKVTERVDFHDDAGEALATLLRQTITLPRGTAAQAAAMPETPLDQVCLDRIAACYRAEPGRRAAAETRDWSRVAPGDRLGPLVKGPLTITNLVGFAMGWGAPLCPTNRILFQWTERHREGAVRNRRTGMSETSEGIHWDADVFSVFGFDRGFDLGPQRFSWIVHLCTDWAGSKARLVELDARLLRPNLVGDVHWFTGEVTAATPLNNGSLRIEADIMGRNQRDELTSVASAVFVTDRILSGEKI